MQDTLKSFWKTKVDLNDYDAKSDIDLRLFLNSLSKKEMSILEEILYSPLQVSIEDLSENLEFSLDELYPLIEKLSLSGLFSFNGTTLFINKEKRKFFETQIERFEEDFEPGMDFLQNILKSVPIHVLPIWYHIPRSSNNIFESLVEKYLLTPQIYQRYIAEFNSGEEIAHEIARLLFDSDGLKLEADFLKEKYCLSNLELEEILVYLEFNLICCSSYEEDIDGWKQVVTPFSEWRKYLLFIKNSKSSSIENTSQITLYRASEYAFIEDMTKILHLTESMHIGMRFNSEKQRWLILEPSFSALASEFNLNLDQADYLHRLAEKILMLGLGVVEETSLKQSESASEWMEMPINKRAHVTFKHPHNFLAVQKISPLATQRAIVEIQKSLSQIADLGWVYFSDYLEKAIIILNDDKKLALTKIGRNWQYTFPVYTSDEVKLIEVVILDWLFESGIVQVGHIGIKPCFCLTTLGRTLLT